MVPTCLLKFFYALYKQKQKSEKIENLCNTERRLKSLSFSNLLLQGEWWTMDSNKKIKNFLTQIRNFWVAASNTET